MSEELKEILEFDFETQGERIEINEYERNKIKDYIINLQQENKQLKEEIENIKDFNNKLQASKDRLDKDDYNLAHILTELEEWLKEKINYIVNYIDKSKVKPYGEELRMLENCANRYNDILDKIQELKEKYK